MNSMKMIKYNLLKYNRRASNKTKMLIIIYNLSGRSKVGLLSKTIKLINFKIHQNNLLKS